MNERIKQLAEQAGFMEAWFSESGDDCEREIKKFAELIVRECMEIASDVCLGDEEGIHGTTVGIVINDISSHFGVEE